MSLENILFDPNIHSHYIEENFYKIFIQIEIDYINYIDIGIACISVKHNLLDLQRCIDNCLASITTAAESRGFQYTAKFIGFKLK